MMDLSSDLVMIELNLTLAARDVSGYSVIFHSFFLNLPIVLDPNSSIIRRSSSIFSSSSCSSISWKSTNNLRVEWGEERSDHLPWSTLLCADRIWGHNKRLNNNNDVTEEEESLQTEEEIIDLPELDNTEHYYWTESQTVEMKSTKSENWWVNIDQSIENDIQQKVSI